MLKEKYFDKEVNLFILRHKNKCLSCFKHSILLNIFYCCLKIVKGVRIYLHGGKGSVIHLLRKCNSFIEENDFK